MQTYRIVITEDELAYIDDILSSNHDIRINKFRSRIRLLALKIDAELVRPVYTKMSDEDRAVSIAARNISVSNKLFDEAEREAVRSSPDHADFDKMAGAEGFDEAAFMEQIQAAQDKKDTDAAVAVGLHTNSPSNINPIG